jgi:hypothetical protein
MTGAKKLNTVSLFLFFVATICVDLARRALIMRKYVLEETTCVCANERLAQRLAKEKISGVDKFSEYIHSKENEEIFALKIFSSI